MQGEQEARVAAETAPEDDVVRADEDDEVMVEDVTPAPPIALNSRASWNGNSDHEPGPGWQRIQASFIDDPHASVVAAADLVTRTVESLVATIRERERSLRGAWEDNGARTDTEMLRTTLRDYRTFYEEISRI